METQFDDVLEYIDHVGMHAVNLGYDPTRREPVKTTRPPRPDVLPSKTFVGGKWLPPVQNQGSCPSCAAWSSTYGLATFFAAKAGDYSPSDPALQASPAYIYIQVMQQDGMSNDDCQGSQLSSYFALLEQGGTPTRAQAPSGGGCDAFWSEYSGGGLQADAAFTLTGKWVDASTNLDDVKAVLASGRPLVYGTSLYTDFSGYAGNPKPYVGNGIIWMSNGTPVGHCMLIVGYDDEMAAFYIMNSFGEKWGSKGYVWMAYDTFSALSQGQAAYATSAQT
jgi:C1A family cysteine protease